METICCPNCNKTNLKVLVVEIWQKDREFILKEGELVEVNIEPASFKDESYDSRLIQCQDCSKEFSPQEFDEIEFLVDGLYS